MGTKGTQTTQATNTNQSYSANPATQAAATQALTGAQTAAAQPFQMPVAPVAGFNPTQTQAFGEVAGAQGMAQPYYNTAATDFSAGSTPITQAQINSYYNPMAQSVTNQLQNIYGEQNAQNQGSLTAQAGGVGADRIAVGMGDLANQQTLAAGQVYSGLYQNALTAAQQQQQQTVQAGTNMAGLGTTAQNTALQGAGALGNSGLQQQQQTQSELNAPYQNELAQIAYQFQTPQYLAGIAGGLAPALGGTTTGVQNSVTTPPAPTALSQVLGAGTAAAGIYGALGGTSSPTYGGGSAAAGDANGGSSTNPLPGLTAADYGVGYARGGDVKSYDEGGQTDQSQLPFPGASIPKMGGAEPIPYTSLPMGGGHSGPLTGGINTAPPQSQSAPASSNSIGSDISAALGVAKLFMKRGGSTPRYADGGGDVSDGGFNALDDAANAPGSTVPVPSWSEFKAHLHNPFPTPDPNATGIRPGSLLDGWINGKASGSSGSANAASGSPYPQGGDPVVDGATTTNSGKTPFPKTDPRKTGAVKIAHQETSTAPGGGKGSTEVNTYIAPKEALPYPDATDRDAGQNMTRSPWMGLINAGATMMSTPGNLGTAIGKGILAGSGTLDKQRTELRSEQELNDKAQKLYQDAQVHLDKYNKMTPYERASVALKNKELDQSGEEGGVPVKFTAANYNQAAQFIAANNPGKTPEQLQPLIDAEVAHRKQVIGGAASSNRGLNTPPGTEKEFDNGKGGKVIGVWDPVKGWVPKGS